MATPNSGNPANNNSGYTSFMQPGNSPDNYRTTYGSDNMGRNMVTSPKPGGPILKITEGGNLPKTPTFSGGIRDKVATTPADRGSNSNRVAGVIGKVGDYLGNVARSARDIPTAVGTAIDTIAPRVGIGPFPKNIKYGLEPAKNLVTQVAQTVGAVAGRKDNSRSDQYSGPTKGVYGNPSTPRRAPGKPTPPKFAINEAAPRPTSPGNKGKRQAPKAPSNGGFAINEAAPRPTGPRKPTKPKTGGRGPQGK